MRVIRGAIAGNCKGIRLSYLLFGLILVMTIVGMVKFPNGVRCVGEEVADRTTVDRSSKWETFLSRSMRLMREGATCSGRNEWNCSTVHCNTHDRELDRSAATRAPECKTLWFVGMSQADFDKVGEITWNSYATLYAAALESVHLHSSDVLQPILMLNGFGNLSSNPEKSSFAKFAASRGAVVINVVELSMQPTIDRLFPIVSDGHRVGPFMRMDIPNVIRSKDLFNLTGVCERFVLYTDSDVLFPNPISHYDMQSLKSSMGNSSIVLYGREYWTHPDMVNTGVMLIDVPGFDAELPDIVAFGEKHGKAFPAFDQGWINAYFSQNEHKRAQLSIYWNWKTYWGTEPSFFEDIKIIHYHGPKPGRCLENIASCDPPDRTCNVPSYHFLVKHGICCDYGKTAFLALELTQTLLNLSLSTKDRF